MPRTAQGRSAGDRSGVPLRSRRQHQQTSSTIENKPTLTECWPSSPTLPGMPRGLQRVGEQPRHAGAAASAGVSMRRCKTRQPAPAAVWASRRRITSDPPRSTAQGLAQTRGVTLLCLGKLLASQARKSRQTQRSKTKGQCGLRKARILCKITDSKPNEVRGTYIKFCPQVMRNATDRWGINKADFRNEIASC